MTSYKFWWQDGKWIRVNMMIKGNTSVNTTKVDKGCLHTRVDVMNMIFIIVYRIYRCLHIPIKFIVQCSGHHDVSKIMSMRKCAAIFIYKVEERFRKFMLPVKCQFLVNIFLKRGHVMYLDYLKRTIPIVKIIFFHKERNGYS